MKRQMFLRVMAAGALLATPVTGQCASSINYVGLAYGSSSAGWGPVTINVPPGTQNGDLMLAYIATQSTDGAWVTPPAGWHQTIKTYNSGQGSQLFWRMANNEPSSYTWSATSYPQGVIRTYRGANTTAPIGATAGCTSTGGSSCQIPAFPETTVAGERYVGFWDFNIASTPINGPADLGDSSRNLTQRSMFSGDKTLTVTGSNTVPAENATVPGAPSHWEGIGVTIKPAASAAAASPPATTPSQPTTAPSAGPGVVAVSANDFLNSLGIVIGPSRESTVSQYATMINYIGVRNIRGAALNGNNAAFSIQIAQATNTKFIWELESGWSGSSLANDIAGAKQLAAAGVLLALEGANEPDNWYVTYNGQQGGGGGGLAARSWLPVAQLQRDFYSAVKADATLKNYPVFSISHDGGETDNVGLQFLTIPPGSGLSMPDGVKYADYANMHNYVIWQGAQTPVDNIAWYSAAPTGHIAPAQYPLMDDYGTTWARHYTGYSDAQLQTLPRVTTETGWISSNGGEDNQSRVLLNVYLAQFKRGYKYTFLYQLRDNEGGWPNSFGIVRADYSYKPAATYIHNLTSILSDHQSVAATPGALNYSIANEPATVHDLLLQKSSGAFELVVWDERPVGETTDHVSVNLGGSHATVNVYDVTAATKPVQTLTNVSSVPLTLSDHPMIIEVVK